MSSPAPLVLLTQAQLARKRRNNGKRFYYKCAISGCLNSTLTTNLSFFSLPYDPARRATWLKMVQREDLIEKSAQHARICEVHFTPSDILVSSKRKLLKKSSVPIPVKRVVSKSTQTISTGEFCHIGGQVTVKTEGLKCDEATHPETIKLALQDHDYTLPQPVESVVETSVEETPQTKNLEHDSGKKNYSSHDTYVFLQLCDKLLSKNFASIVKEQANLKSKSCGNRYSTEYKAFCLRLYHTSPKAYGMLSETLCLPHRTSLNFMEMPLVAGSNINLIEILETKIELAPQMEKNCSLVIDTMHLKANLYYNIAEDKIYGFHDVDEEQSPELAKEALVAMVQGISGSYKQLVGYALLGECRSSKSISEWIDKLIQNLFNIGLKVRVMTSTLNSVFFDIAKQRSVTPQTPYFFCNDRKIYYIFDAPHLIMILRNHFMKYDFLFMRDGIIEEAKWEYLLQLYQVDKIKKLRVAPKLTKSHVQPVEMDKEKVELAVQLFSHSVAAGLSSYRDFGAIPVAAGGTIALIEIMKDLVDFLYSSRLNSDKKYQNAYSAEEYQTSFIGNMIKLFASLKLYNSLICQNATEEVTFIDGFQITLNSIFLLYQDFEMENLTGSIYKHLYTKRLTLNCLKSFVREMKSKRPTSEKNSVVPSSWQLDKAFQKKKIVHDFSKMKSCIDILEMKISDESNLDTNIDNDLAKDDGINNEESLILTADVSDLIKQEKEEEIYIEEHDVLTENLSNEQVGYTKIKTPSTNIDTDKIKKHRSNNQESPILTADISCPIKQEEDEEMDVEKHLFFF